MAKNDDDTVTIAVMGPTGGGKSTFINLVSGSKLIVSSYLESCTQDVQAAGKFKLDNRSVQLIDAPGFDDTSRSDVEILKLIAAYLATQYEKGTTLHGVLYLHRISDNRVGGISRQSFKLFRNLCGERTFKNVAIVTTMWGKVPLEEGENREMELRTNAKFFKPALDEQAIMLRHNNTFESACDVIRRIFANHPLPLALQEELVDNQTPLPVTNVGRELAKDLQESAQKIGTNIGNTRVGIAAAAREKDEKTKQELEDELHKSCADLARARNELKNLRECMVRGIDVKKEWNNMQESAKLATLFRRSLGAPEALEADMFWSALGDTTKAVSEIHAIFNRYPLPPGMQEKLLQNTSAPDEYADVLLKSWMKEHSKEFRAMKVIMKEIRNKTKGGWFWQRWTRRSMSNK